MKNYIAVGFTVNDEAIARNGMVENYGARTTRVSAVAAWLYTHKLHDGRAVVSKNGIGNCPKHGQFAIVKDLATGAPIE